MDDYKPSAEAIATIVGIPALKCSNSECRAPVHRAGYCGPCKADYNARWEIMNAQHRRAYWKARRKGLPRPRLKEKVGAGEAQPSEAPSAEAPDA